MSLFQIGHAQTANNPNSKNYEIGGIKVTGVTHSDAQALIAMTGLKVGRAIQIPGPDLQRAMKGLWKIQLFTDVQILKEKTVGDIVFLEIVVEERPRLSRHQFIGVKKKYQNDLNAAINRFLLKGGIVTENLKRNVQTAIEQFFTEKGYPDAQVMIQEIPDPNLLNTIQLRFQVEQGNRVKVQGISFTGNTQVPARKLRKLLPTKRKSKLFTASKLLPEELETGKQSILTYYQNLGYRDAQIIRDSLWRDAAGNWQIQLNIAEGQAYYFGNIVWKGNSIYNQADLTKVLGIKKGDLYNTELLETRLRFSPDGRDVSSLYLDNGHLFFNLDIIETSLHDDTVDLELRLYEGPVAVVDKVVIRGNEKTHEEVIRRELRTQPGKKFSRADIIRSQRDLLNMGYFNPEKLGVNTPVNPERATVSIEYDLEERNSDQFEISGGWTPGVGLTGTAGVTLNNFSAKKLLDPSSWSPYPMGDGQRVSLRIQSNGKPFQSYSFSFTEPWLGGKKPNSLNIGGYFTRYMDRGVLDENGNPATLSTVGLSATIGSRLKFPDDNFVASITLDFKRYALHNWTDGLFRTDDGQVVSDGRFYNFSLTQTIARSTVDNPLFPTQGSRLSLSLQATPPYSLLDNKNYNDLVPNEKFKLLEYHKWRFDAEWYTSFSKRLVLKTSANFGFLGSYNQSVGLSPFERFRLGGAGIDVVQNSATGTDAFALRGYDVVDLENNFINGQEVATPLFSKYSLELRYLVSPNPNATAYVLAFAEAGNAWQSLGDYNPFDVKRSVGAGFRVFLPMFGTLGVDYGIGLDKAGGKGLQNRGQISFILGFQPK